MPRRIEFALLLGFAAVADVRAADAPPLDRRGRGDLAIRARAVLRKYCADCHGNAPAGSRLSVLDHKQLVAAGRPVPFVNLDAPRSQVIELIEDGSMPPGGRDRPTADEIAALRAWVAAKAPSYPLAFDDRTTVSVMLADLDRQAEGTRPHLRYLSLAHLVGDDSVPDLKAAEQRLQKALLAASGKPVAPPPVDDTATLFRLDLRELGWDTPDLFDRVERGAPKSDAFPMIPYDVLLLDYPHTVALPEKDPLRDRLKSYYAATKVVRPVPFLRVDWLGDTLAPLSPLAADMKSLVELGAALKNGEPSCGPPVRAFTIPKSVGPSPVPPLTAWYGGDVVPNPEPFKLTTEVVGMDGQPLASVKVGHPFRLKVTAGRDARFVLLSVLSTGEVRVQPVGGGTVLTRDRDRFLGPNQAGGFVVASLLRGGDAATEHFVVIAAEGEVPVPAVARSRHADCRDKDRFPVWRFVFEKTPDGFDPARTVRKVVVVAVTAEKP